MKSKYLSVTIVMLSCVLIIALIIALIIGEINPGAEIRYWTKEDVKELRSKLLDD